MQAASKNARTFFAVNTTSLRVEQATNPMHIPPELSGIDVLNHFVSASMRDAEAARNTLPPPPRRVFVPPERRAEPSTHSQACTLPRLGYARAASIASLDETAQRNGVLHPSMLNRTRNLLLPVPKYGLDLTGQYAIPTLPPIGRGSAQRMFRLADSRVPPE